ncbi:MAG TPA: hypothetical protein VJ372_22365 [Pyrinomonadaceae bacterium]|nr:hypothetical protein [Pyrinomonadaceae bacterium]
MKGLILLLVTMTLLIVVVPSDAAAQGRGYGRRDSSWGKKCDKFVNCHDARDGKWSDRGNRRAYGDRAYWRHYRNGTYSNYRNRTYTNYGNRVYPTHRNRIYGTYRVRRPIRY